DNRRPVTAAEPRPKSKVTPFPGTLSIGGGDLVAELMNLGRDTCAFLDIAVVERQVEIGHDGGAVEEA
ncbi:hypothetical protein, partial [Alterinioella nitratireducens]|uniref:hypothetical protein n=1 Tax=Alterinioella nitratireducens TaxID=2735915 RepID=UPI001BE4B2F4